MRWCGWIFLCLSLVLAGCGHRLTDTYAPGPVDPGLYHKAVIENEQRLAGEDRRVVPLYRNPLDAIGVAYDQGIAAPIRHLFDYMEGDTPGVAAHKMLDDNSPDNRRAGVLRLTDFAFARKGDALQVYAHIAGDEDYTVRAAGLRALNRSRAAGYTAVFLHGLEDDNTLVRLQAAEGLGNVPDPNAMDAMIAHLQSDVSTDVRIACAEALRNFHTLEAARALVNVLNDKNFGVAWQARQSLELLTGQDFRYDTKAWLDYILNAGTFG